MKKITNLILLFSLIISCQKAKVDDRKKQNKNDFSTIELKVERGAFHNDTFILKDTVITFYPEKEQDSDLNQQYYTISEQAISKSERDLFLQKILDAGIWNLNEKYTPEDSCTSNVIITISLTGKTKRIECEDFVRECPDIIKFIESEMVRLHGKGLERIFLPG
ncbi:hypothetical protein [Aureibaculum conchae]|uniref:hypothetical protein n=1 Tax=Aureibaculum sp. 2308TA14-22 TaxID=3108392 RepID=UPI003398B52A